MFDTDFENAAVVSLERVEERKRSRLPTINMFYYTYISYDDYTILIHSFNCPAIKQVFLFFSPHLIIIINLLLLNIITHLVESSRFVVLVNHHWIVNFYVLRVFLFGSFSSCFFFFFFFFPKHFNQQTVHVRDISLLQQRRFRSVTNHDDPTRFVWQNRILWRFFFIFYFCTCAHTREIHRDERQEKKKRYGKRTSAFPARPREKYNQRRTRAK